VFFHRTRWKDTGVFIFFVLLSLGFWFLQSLQQDYEIELSIPVKYKNTPADMLLTARNPEMLVVKVRDRGAVLLNYEWRAFAPIELNLKELQKEANQPVTIDRRFLETSVSKHLMSSTSILSIDPQSFQVEFAALRNKKVPVVADVSVTLEPGFQVSDTITISPAEVSVFASSAILDSVLEVRTVPAKLNKARKTKELELSLQTITGVRIEPDEVKVKIPVEEFTEKRLTLPILCDDLPRGYNLHTFPPSVDVICSIPISRFKEFTESDFEIRIPFREFEAHQASGEIPVRLTKQPLLMVAPLMSPNIIEFILEQNNP
jgi:hypothetical protein